MAYTSTESGHSEVYVQAFPDGGRRWQISVDGGSLPYWNPKGGELVYRGRDGLMAAAYSTTPELHTGAVTRLFETGDLFFGVAPDGRFLMVRQNRRSAGTQLKVAFNWFASFGKTL